MPKIGKYEYNDQTGEWEVRISDEGWFSCKTQTEAEILSTLVRIEMLLQKIMEEVKT